MLEDVKILVLRHVGHIIHELRRRRIERIGEQRFRVRWITVTHRAVLTIETSAVDQVPFVPSQRIRRLGGSAIGYITPKDMLAGHQQDIQADRDRKLEAAREQRKNRRQRAA